MASERVKLADIRDKDNAHPHGIVGWRSEYHAMREALDGLLAVKFDTHVNPWSTDTDHGFAQGMALAKERVLSAIESVIDLEGDERG